VQGPLPREAGEVPQYPRVTLAFNRRDVGRLRLLVDRLNALVTDHAPAGEASPREVLEEALPPEAERAEEAE